MSFMYTQCTENMLTPGIDWEVDNIGVAAFLTTTNADGAISRDATTITLFSNEIVEARQILSPTVVKDATNNKSYITATATTFANVTVQGNIKGFVIFDYTGGLISDSTNVPLLWVDDGGASFDIVTDGTDVVVTWPAGGLTELKSDT